jgi:copper chaperone CopZ
MSIVFKVEGMACEGCASTVQNTASAFDGVEEANVDFESKQLSVSGNIDIPSFKKAIADAGYPLTEKNESQS